MSLVFPVEMPWGVASEYFEPERLDAISPTNDGNVSGVTLGFPLWRARWTLGQSISRQTSEEWRAFIAVLRGQQRTFLGYDQGRRYPLSAPDGFAGLTRVGGGAFDGSATSWSVNTTRDEAALSGFPAGFVVSIGDYIMWRWETGGVKRRAMSRAVLPAVANGSGVATVLVEPPLPTLVPGSAVADMKEPACVMKQVTDETKLGEKTRTLRIGGTIAAIQVLLP
ncbi:hypothetical protein [Brevundimonas sp. BAL3]|uniref:hypothetical protein n=1 Tax=Brevundimonas sp. BAL3 TaxID=391600 RepID=UPI0012EAA5E7|nr:hypothetical protein [Brevundimonas sp. BAL3]